MTIPQLFIKIGSNRYATVDKPVRNKDLYAWDDSKGRIVPYTSDTPRSVSSTDRDHMLKLIP